MEHVLLNGLGFDLYVPRDQYEACVAELRGIVTSHGAARPDLAVLLQRHAEFLATQATHLPWTTLSSDRSPHSSRIRNTRLAS